jgi:hypothetical protein
MVVVVAVVVWELSQHCCCCCCCCCKKATTPKASHPGPHPILAIVSMDTNRSFQGGYTANTARSIHFCLVCIPTMPNQYQTFVRFALPCPFVLKIRSVLDRFAFVSWSVRLVFFEAHLFMLVWHLVPLAWDNASDWVDPRQWHWETNHHRLVP